MAIEQIEPPPAKETYSGNLRALKTRKDSFLVPADRVHIVRTIASKLGVPLTTAKDGTRVRVWRKFADEPEAALERQETPDLVRTETEDWGA